MMTMAIKGKSVQTAEALFRKFQAMVTQKRADDEVFDEELENLEAMAGVREYPSRIKCAVLPWHTLHEALTKSD
jgi:nitrogen fixation NifU-like protein